MKIGMSDNGSMVPSIITPDPTTSIPKILRPTYAPFPLTARIGVIN